MTHRHAPPRHRLLSRALHRWHRRVGVAASLFAIWMVASGWLLNHTAALDLARHLLRSDWIAEHYGLRAALPDAVVGDGGHWFAATEDAAIFDGRKIAVTLPAPLGLVAYRDMLFVAGRDRIVLLAVDGALIDRIDATMLPVKTIERIGRGCSAVAIANGDEVFASVDGATWQPCAQPVSWMRGASPSAAQAAAMKALLQPGISIERLLLDLHSGRFFGRWGPYFVDVVGLALLALALSGVWMFAYQRRRQRAH